MKKRILSSKKAERLRRETDKERKERWNYRILIAVLAVVGIVVSTAVAVYQGKLDRETRNQDPQQLAGPTNKNDLKTSATQEETFKQQP